MNIKDTKLTLDYLNQIEYKDNIAQNVHSAVYNCNEILKILENRLEGGTDSSVLMIAKMYNILGEDFDSKNPIQRAINHIKARKDFDNKTMELISSGLYALMIIGNIVNTNIDDDKKMNEINKVLSDFEWQNDIIL